MAPLFEFFLFVGARDFLPRYRELKQQGRVNEGARRYYLIRFYLCTLLAFTVAMGMFWVAGILRLTEGVEGAGFSLSLQLIDDTAGDQPLGGALPLVIALVISLYIWWSLIEMVGKMAHVYSRGRVAKTTVMGTKSNMGRGFNVLHRFELGERVIETSFTRQIGQKTYWDWKKSNKVEILYAEDKPEMTVEYASGDETDDQAELDRIFVLRCLDSSRTTAPRD
ncbi:hypothetical protein O4H49_03150 [Kiloniella laminariae]|uniref:DUF5673 domain-containing protein n=1 Tax=Kiloniella laminariae TaxID=454162 RepID=A0ABT4LF81_9PROT|nr:hypothetical protein [Kiloniella laminariae]MCZ4279760.1 hypothetical protein [Kiloniella laminariae]